MQIAIGSILCATGVLSTLGISLINIGVDDIIYAVQAYRNNNFSWKNYFINKAISIALIIISCGIGKFVS